MGAVFGFLLEKGGVTRYDVILGQLLLKDFTVLKVILSAIAVGSIGIHIMHSGGLVSLSPKWGSIGSSLLGGIVFGIAFAILGYCPGTIAGAIGTGALDALAGGLPGIFLGSWLFSLAYPSMKKAILARGTFGTITIPEYTAKPWWLIVVILNVLIMVGFVLLELQS